MRIRASIIGISLCFTTATAFAQENSWASKDKARAEIQAPAVTLGRPIPAASLGQPVPLASSEPGSVQPTAFEKNSNWNPQPAAPAALDLVPELAPISSEPATDKPKASTESAPAPLPVPNTAPQNWSGAPAPPPASPTYASAPTNATMGGIGTGFPYGWGAGPAMSLFGPLFPYAGGPNRFYFSAEFLLWWVNDAHAPALAITTPVVPSNTTPVPQPATVLFGDGVNGLYPTNRYGARFNLGMWFNPNQCRGIDFGFLFLGTAGTNYVVNSNQQPIILRPFFNLNRNEPFSEIVAAPGVSTGSLSVTGESSFWGADVNYRRALLRACDCYGRLDALVGFRYLHLNENVTISESFTSTATTNGVPTATGTVFDRFSTINDFYGGQLGLVFNRQWGRWSIDATTKVALGVTASQANISGGQNLVLNGVPTTANAGLLALSTNSGTHNTSSFSVVPEVGVNVGYQITPRMKVFVGYSFLYWSNVLRPGNQIDTGVDVTRIPNFNPIDANGNPITTPVANRPAATLPRTDFWAQGVNFGLQFKW